MFTIGIFELLIILVILGVLVGGAMVFVRLLRGPRDPGT